MIRGALYLLWLAISVIPFALAIMLVSIGGSGKTMYTIAWVWLRQMQRAIEIIGGVRYRLHGEENIQAAQDFGRIILSPKHQSAWETFALPVIMPKPLAFVFKKELLSIPFFGWALGRLDMVHIDRSKRTEAWDKVAEEGAKLMDMGIWVIMFPEGTRSVRGQQRPYKTGASRLAVATEAAMLPIAVTSARCWPRASFRLTPGIIDVSIGEPIPAAGRDPDELMAEVETWVEAEMRRLDPEAYSNTRHMQAAERSPAERSPT